MTERRVAFIDHSFHLQTGSSGFFRTLLERRYRVDVYDNTCWEDGRCVDVHRLNATPYHAIIFWQSTYDHRYLARLHCTNILIVPMLDDLLANTHTPFYWRQFPACKFIAFSTTLAKRLEADGLSVLQLRYFPPPGPPPGAPTRRALFWYRTARLGWETVRRLIPPGYFDEIVIHHAPDPGEPPLQISDEEQRRYRIRITEWFEHKSDYLDLLGRCDLFFAPRPDEGIGLAFLEAMAAGVCVACVDRPTMNEYVTHEENGWLYDPKHPLPPDPAHLDALGKRAYESIREGYETWKGQEAEIGAWIDAPSPPPSQVAPWYGRLDRLLALPMRGVAAIIRRCPFPGQGADPADSQGEPEPCRGSHHPQHRSTIPDPGVAPPDIRSGSEPRR